jgi:hypothetical protein
MNDRRNAEDELQVPSQRTDERQDRDLTDSYRDPYASPGDVLVAHSGTGADTGPHFPQRDDTGDTKAEMNTDQKTPDHLEDPDGTGFPENDRDRKDLHGDTTWKDTHETGRADAFPDLTADDDGRVGDIDAGNDADHDRRAETLPGASDPAHAVPAAEVTPETGLVHEVDPAHAAAPHSDALFDQDPDEVQGRWREVQIAFVDDPKDAVQRADDLLGEVVTALTTQLTARTGELRERWSADGGDTEKLRLALRDYRTTLERLLALSKAEVK